MDELKLGKVTNKELISWLGTTDSQMRTKKKELLKKLEEYCEFTPVYGGIMITKIYKPCYVKNLDLEIVREEFCEAWDKSGLDSCSRVSEEIYEKRYSDFKNELGTIYNKTRQVRDEFYGKPCSNLHGSRGICNYVLCKKNKNTGRLEFLSEEEENIKKELMKEYFSTAEEKTIIVQTMIRNGELTEAEAWKYYSKLVNLPGNYQAFMSAFKTRTGITLIRGTVIEDGICFEEKGEKIYEF